ncbi:polyphosphate kinase [Rhodococcus sp. OAS809]
MVQVKDPKLSKQLGDIFDSALDPRTRCWVLHPDGSWVAAPERGEDVREHQQSLMRSRTASGS